MFIATTHSVVALLLFLYIHMYAYKNLHMNSHWLRIDSLGFILLKIFIFMLEKVTYTIDMNESSRISLLCIVLFAIYSGRSQIRAT